MCLLLAATGHAGFMAFKPCGTCCLGLTAARGLPIASRHYALSGDCGADLCRPKSAPVRIGHAASIAFEPCDIYCPGPKHGAMTGAAAATLHPFCGFPLS